ncbi:MAG TPA: ferritin-like domain-containing protein [Spongiibacteraceae bacterium]|nr:ferritin-like domain-containing protein [Spongiibacteraceae bacterium]
MSAIPAGYPDNQMEAFALLATRDKLSIDDLKILALLETAGEAFYFAAAAAVDNPEAKALLTRNGQEERGHAHRVLKAITLMGGEPYTLPDAEGNPYIQPMQLDGMISSELLAMIAQGEQDGDLQYQTWAAAEANEEIAKIYRQNGSEETRHGERVAQVATLLN